ncbi:hypothetical protein VHEMI01415 [[Torrubiella] hemipterigena]|uniref:Uncharacterized protein n=1 Tax=[Torrubiella] hemipterigena TaxID=1531966 RepID=A0A0A1T4Q1_9HYPO|nr:hypothetical protein VHEMI01415 [[Torrubiella] hemipterigena]
MRQLAALAFLSLTLASPVVQLGVPPLPGTNSTTDGCTGTMFAHLYGWEAGCGAGYQTFNYELWQFHYITSDGSGDCGTIHLNYFTGLDQNGDKTSVTMQRNQCININTGGPVNSISMYC